MLMAALCQAQDEFTVSTVDATDGIEDVEFTQVPLQNSSKRLILCPVTATDLNLNYLKEYYDYLRQFGKAYECKEDFPRRYALYSERRQEIDRFNADPSATYVQGANLFTDLTDNERIATFLGVPEKDDDNFKDYEREAPDDNLIDGDLENIREDAEQESFTANLLNVDVFKKLVINFDFLCCKFNPFGVPCKKDWQSLGKVSSVKNQGGCGSCWAFAAVAAVESSYLINYNCPLNLSEQELVSCATSSWGNFGCSGGWPHKALDYIIAKRNHKEINYPYTATNSVCTNPPFYKYPIKSRTIVLPQNRMDTFLQALNKRPIAVAFKVTGSFFNYKSGIYNPAADAGCATPGINHAVLAVGFNIGCFPFIRFKNSWGSGWGENGYFRMKLSKNIFQNGPCNLINHPYNVYPGL